MRQPDYKDRSLEVHGINMWNGYRVERAIEFAKKFNPTGIISHCNDIIGRAIRSDEYFPPNASLLSYNNRDKDTKNHKYHLGNVIDKIMVAGLEFCVEVKEIYYPHEILQEFPYLRKENGAACPTELFWWEFLEEKICEFVRRFPKVSEITVSAGTGGSMVPLAANKCECEHCRRCDVNLWYRKLVTAIFKSLDAAGKKLIVRDFSYTTDHQYAVVGAARDVSEKIIMMLKRTPHDYYLVFPDNPSVDNRGNLEQWTEFDAWGRYFGLGIIPCSMTEDAQGRLQCYLEEGTSGIMLRTSWGRLLQGSTFSSFNIFNLIARAILGADVNMDLDDAYREWLRFGLASPLEYDPCPQEPCVSKAPQAFDVSKRLMKDSWKILEKILYARGHVFSRNAQMLDRYSLTYFIMTVQHTRDHWDAGASEKVQPVGDHIEIMLREKQEARQMAADLRNWLEPEALGVSADIEKYLNFVLDVYEVYVEIFDAQTRTAAWIRKVEQSCSAEGQRSIGETLAEYDRLADRLAAMVSDRGYSNNMEYVVDPERTKRFKENCSRALDELGG